MAPLQKSKSAIQATDQLQIQHFTHQHLLHKVYMTVEFNCDGCNTGGYGIRYRCSGCDFDLHEQCATCPHRTFSNLHPHHQLVLVNRPGDSHFCGVCRGFTNGLSYTCEHQTCEYDVHPLCVKIPVANGVPPVTVDRSQGGVSWGQPGPTTQQVNVNQQQPATSFGGYYELNHNQQQKQETPFGGYYELNHNQPMIVNHPQHQQQLQHQHQHQHQQQQQKQQLHQQQPGSPMMINHHQQPQQQLMHSTSFNGYNGMNTNQPMINHHQPQLYQQGMPVTTNFGGYNGINNYNNQSVMSNQQQQQQQPAKSSNYSKMGKFAANILTTSIIGVPLFNQRN